MTVARYSVMGVNVADASQSVLVSQITDLVQSGQRALAIGVNAQVCNLAASNSKYLKLVEQADLRYADGQSVVWAGRILGGKFPERCATTDLIYPVARQAAEQGWRVFMYGAAPGVAEKAAARLQGLHPELVVGTHHGYVSTPQQHQKLMNELAKFSPDLILIGLGEPAQQRWVDEHQHQLPPAVVLTCGGLFDWLSGAQVRPPEWMVKAGLEWVWRLCHEPTRLWRRYVIGNPAFVARFARQLMSAKWNTWRSSRR